MTNKILYEVGQRVRLQNVSTRDWELKGTIDQIRTTDDGRVVSYDVLPDKGPMTTRHRRYLRPLHRDHDPKIPKNKNDTDNDDTANDVILTSEEKADLPTIEQTAVSGEQLAPRRSGRRSVGVQGTVRTVRNMGGSESKLGCSCNTISATVQLCNCAANRVPWGRYQSGGNWNK